MDYVIDVEIGTRSTKALFAYNLHCVLHPSRKHVMHGLLENAA